VQDRDHDIDAGQRRGNALRGDGQGLDCGAAVAFVDLSGDTCVQRPRLAGLELPFPLAVDLDRDRLVAIGIERLQHGARGGHGNLVLAGATPHDHGYAQLFRRFRPESHGTAVVVPV